MGYERQMKVLQGAIFLGVAVALVVIVGTLGEMTMTGQLYLFGLACAFAGAATTKAFL